MSTKHLWECLYTLQLSLCLALVREIEVDEVELRGCSLVKKDLSRATGREGVGVCAAAAIGMEDNADGIVVALGFHIWNGLVVDSARNMWYCKIVLDEETSRVSAGLSIADGAVT